MTKPTTRLPFDHRVAKKQVAERIRNSVNFGPKYAQEINGMELPAHDPNVALPFDQMIADAEVKKIIPFVAVGEDGTVAGVPLDEVKKVGLRARDRQASVDGVDLKKVAAALITKVGIE